MPDHDSDLTRTTAAPPRSDTTPLGETAQLAAANTAPWPPARSDRDTPERIGEFEIRGVLGEGSFGIVYRGFDPKLRREVAIKVPNKVRMTPEQVESFIHEAQAVANIHHQNVCPVYASGVDGGRPFIVMHLVPNTLEKVLAVRQTPFAPRDAAAIARKLALGVAAAHALGVTHRDLKPANILVQDATSELLITDFGLALLEDETRASSEGDRKGTPAYMAPEQAKGDIEAIGPLSDVYALGVILYELLTKTRPFNARTLTALLRKVEDEPAAAPSRLRPGIPTALDAICLKAMAKRPADRYPSAKEFLNALTSYLRSASAPPPVAPRPVPPKPAPVSLKPSPPPEIVEILETETPHNAEELPARVTRDEMQLLEAVTAGDWNRIKELVSRGVNVNARSDQGASVLFSACLSADERLVKLLLDLGADPNLNAEGEAIATYAPKPLDVVMQAMMLTDWSRYKPCFDLLLKRGASDWQGRVPSPAEIRMLREKAEELRRNPGLRKDRGSWWQFWK